MDKLSLDVVVTRGAVVESRHRVHAAVVDATGALIASAHDADVVAHWRSCAKPFQVMPLLASGGFDRAGWGDDQLALACASHGGEPEHVAIVEAMLAQAQLSGWPAFGYERQDHPVQRGCLDEVARWSGVDASRIPQAIDGCGCVVFALPLVPMAIAFARLADAARRSEGIPSRVVHAMQTRPFLLGGTDRFDSALIEATEGRVIAKIGAEGVHTAAVVEEGLGIAVKVEDGTPRAQFPALLGALQHLGALPRDLPPRLAEFMQRPLRNTRGEVVGEVRLERATPRA